jgi:hypothetical protein
MKRNGELVVRAIEFWHHHFCKEKVTAAAKGTDKKNDKKRRQKGETIPPKTASHPKKWNVDANDVSRDVFTTVFTADLESIIEDLSSGKSSKKEAAQQLRGMTDKLKQPVVNKRAIPGYLPSDKNIYRGVSSIALLGSRPSAMTLSDSRKMNIPPPIDSSSDRIRVSMNRLIIVLGRLGFEKSEVGGDVTAMIKQLWTESRQYGFGDEGGPGEASKLNGGDVESHSKSDEIELGVLKWVLYGVPANQPSWFSKVCCMPCSKLPKPQTFPDHPAASLQQKSGDLVSHDVLTCLLCRDATGCIQFTDGQNHASNLPLKLPSKETESDDSVGDAGVEMEELANHLLLKEHE